jgi:hypothetical protein
LCLTTAAAAAEEGPELVTDRPDQTESTGIVERGSYQIEAGHVHSVARDGGFVLRSDSTAQALLRTGLGRRSELRVGLDGYLSETESFRARETSDRSGLGDASIGAKLRLANETGRRPALAVLGTLSVPSGSSEFTSDRLDPSFRALFSHSPAADLSLGYNLGAAWSTAAGDDGERHTTSALEWTLSAGIDAGHGIGFFAELFGCAPLSAAGTPATSVDLGATYLIRRNVQLDAAAGVGLSSAAEDWFAGFGISVRLPR